MLKNPHSALVRSSADETDQSRKQAAQRLATILERAAADGYSPELVAMAWKDWAGFETDDGLGFDESALRVFSALPHPFPFSRAYQEPTVRDALLAVDRTAVETSNRPHPARNRLQRARAAYRQLVSCLPPGTEAQDGIKVLTDSADALREALAATDTAGFLRALQRIALSLQEPVSQDRLIERLFQLLGHATKTMPPDEKHGILAELSVEMTGGERRIVFISSLKLAMEHLSMSPGDKPALLIECGDA